MNALRVIDTGLQPPDRNIALTATLAELRGRSEIPDTLRFQRFTPCVLLGRTQDAAREVRLDVCREKGIALARRLTGGGAVYMDAGILSWQLVADRRKFGANLAAAGETICIAVADALVRLGMPACFSPPNAIAIEGKKVGGAAGSFEGAILVYEGTVLVDCDLDLIAEVLSPAYAHRLTNFAARGLAPSLAELQRAITVSICNYCNFSVSSDRLSPRERTLAMARSAAKLDGELEPA